MLALQAVHHIALICSDYQKSKRFYTDVLGFEILGETYREARGSFKLDLSLNGQYLIELFSFPNPPARASGPEACGLRHLAFQVADVEAERKKLMEMGVEVENCRIDEFTGKTFTFFRDPDGLPIELYQM